MAVAKYKTWLEGEVLSAADLNASFDQVFNNQQSFGTPRTAAWDMDGQELILDGDADTSITADTDDLIDFRLQGQDLVKFDGTTATAVNGLTVLAAATTNAVQVKTHGSDTNIGLTLVTKGTGKVISRVGSVDILTVDGATASSVNGITITSSAAGGIPSIAATGSDTDIQLALASKGIDPVVLRVGAIDVLTNIVAAGTIVNGFTTVATATGNQPELRATGSDTDIGIKIVPKGAGTVILAGSVVTATPGAAAVPIANGSGKLADGWISSSSVVQHSRFKLLATFSPSGASTVDIDNTVITSGYLPLCIRFELLFSTDDTELCMRTDDANGVSVDSGASDYSYGGHGISSAGTALVSNSAGATSIVMCDTSAGFGIGNAGAEIATGMIWVRFLGNGTNYPTFNYNLSYLDPSTRSADFHGTGHRRSGTAINFIRLFPTAGTVSGTVQVYGWQTS